MSFRSATLRRAGSIILVRMIAVARHRTLPRVKTGHRSTPRLGHRLCLSTVTRTSPLDPPILPISSSHLSCLLSRLREDCTSSCSFACHSVVSALQKVDPVLSSWEPLSVRGLASPRPRRVGFLRLLQISHCDPGPVVDSFLPL